MTENKIKGISHITFVCKDLEKTSHFLKELFDAQEVYSSGDKTFSIAKEKFFKIGDLWIAIMEGESINQTYNHIAFSIDEKSLPLFEVKIKDLGLKTLPGRSRKQDEGKSIYFYDYDNHLFELHTGSLKTRLKLYKRRTNGKIIFEKRGIIKVDRVIERIIKNHWAQMALAFIAVCR